MIIIFIVDLDSEFNHEILILKTDKSGGQRKVLTRDKENESIYKNLMKH